MNERVVPCGDESMRCLFTQYTIQIYQKLFCTNLIRALSLWSMNILYVLQTACGNCTRIVYF